MSMKVIKTEKCLCTCCMEEHEVKTVLLRDKVIFKNVNIAYDATYYYCELAEELYADEHMMRENDIKLKDAYRKSEGLLTSSDIVEIRSKYGISQTDLCVLLGWGGKTITRYESYQIQDKAHDAILKKLSIDPEWFLSLLNGARNNISEDSFNKYWGRATSLYEQNKDLYLRRAIEADYAKYQGNNYFNGNTMLSLDKVVGVIRYLASNRNVTSLYAVKLMKLLWYVDSLSYKRRGHAITGLVYQALPMGAVPIGYKSIIDLKGVPCEEEFVGDGNAYHFHLACDDLNDWLSPEEKQILDSVIKELGRKSKDEIVDFMHKERAYLETEPKKVISFEYAQYLQI